MFDNVTNITMKGQFRLNFSYQFTKLMACENNFCGRDIAPKNQG